MKEDQPLKLATACAWAVALQEVPKASCDGTRFATEITGTETAAAESAVTVHALTLMLGSKETAGGAEFLGVARGMALRVLG